MKSGDRSSTVVKVLYYKSEGRWFDPSWCHCIQEMIHQHNSFYYYINICYTTCFDHSSGHHQVSRRDYRITEGCAHIWDPISGVIGFFIYINSFRSHYGPGVDSASNRNEYQEHFLGVKAAGA